MRRREEPVEPNVVQSGSYEKNEKLRTETLFYILYLLNKSALVLTLLYCGINTKHRNTTLTKNKIPREMYNKRTWKERQEYSVTQYGTFSHSR